MSLERIYNALLGLGLSETDSKIYIQIAVKGQLTAKKIIEDLKINKQQLYPILRKLQHKKIIEVSDNRPIVISAIPFEKVLEMLINSKIEKSKEILGSKKDLISYWKAVKWNNCT